MKISDNNIENIYNININIQGVFTNNIEQDIVSVVLGLLNQQGIEVGGTDGDDTLKDKLIKLAQKSGSKDLDINVPANSLGQKFNFDGLADKIQEAIAKKSDGSATESSAMDDMISKLIANSQKSQWSLISQLISSTIIANRSWNRNHVQNVFPSFDNRLSFILIVIEFCYQ